MVDWRLLSHNVSSFPQSDLICYLLYWMICVIGLGYSLYVGLVRRSCSKVPPVEIKMHIRRSEVMQRHRQASGGSSSCASVIGLRVPSSPAPPTPLIFLPLPLSLSSSYPPTSSSLPPPPPPLPSPPSDPPPPCRCSSASTQRTRMWQIKLKCQCPVMR